MEIFVKTYLNETDPWPPNRPIVFRYLYYSTTVAGLGSQVCSRFFFICEPKGRHYDQSLPIGMGKGNKKAMFNQ